MQTGKGKMLILTFLILQVWAVGFARETLNKIKTGIRDEITLSSVTKVGTLTLQPGQYILEHRMSHGKHAMHFVSFIPYGGLPGHGRTYYPSGPMGISEVGKQACELEPLKAKVEQTRIFLAEENGVKWISRIEIKGENVAHLF